MKYRKMALLYSKEFLSIKEKHETDYPDYAAEEILQSKMCSDNTQKTQTYLKTYLLIRL